MLPKIDIIVLMHVSKVWGNLWNPPTCELEGRWLGRLSTMTWEGASLVFIMYIHNL